MSLSLQNLPGLIPTLLFEYVVLLLIFGCYRHYCCRCCLSSCYGAEALENSGSLCESFKFEDTYESFKPILKYALLVTRFMSFAYILGVSVISNYVITGNFKWFYFTLWNVELLSFYYFLALICSTIGIFHSPRRSASDVIVNLDDGAKSTESVVWSVHIVRLGKITHILFEVCSGTAVLVTVINFGILNRDFSFWNTTSHLAPLLSLLLELSLNNMYLRVDHYIYNISWALLYLIFVWPLVALENISFWPYPFLAVDTSYCYLFYTILVVLDILFYFIFYSISFLKDMLRQDISSAEESEVSLQTNA